MNRPNHTILFSILISGSLLASSGCIGIPSPGINLGPFAVPVPVSPYFQDQQELDFHNYKRYEAGSHPGLTPLEVQHRGSTRPVTMKCFRPWRKLPRPWRILLFHESTHKVRIVRNRRLYRSASGSFR